MVRMTSTRPARGGTRERARVEGAVGRGVREARRKRTVLPEGRVVAGRELVAVFRSRINEGARDNETDSRDRSCHRGAEPSGRSACEIGSAPPQPTDEDVRNNRGQN